MIYEGSGLHSNIDVVEDAPQGTLLWIDKSGLVKTG